MPPKVDFVSFLMPIRTCFNVFEREPREWFKVAEIILGLICLGITRGVVLMGGRPDWFLLSFFTPSAYILITCILLMTKLIEDHLKPPLSEIIFDLIAVLLYFTSGCCSCYYYSIFMTAPKFEQAGLAYGVISITTSVVYLIDVALPFKENVPTPSAIRHFAQKNLRVWN